MSLSSANLETRLGRSRNSVKAAGSTLASPIANGVVSFDARNIITTPLRSTYWTPNRLGY